MLSGQLNSLIEVISHFLTLLLHPREATEDFKFAFRVCPVDWNWLLADRAIFSELLLELWGLIARLAGVLLSIGLRISQTEALLLIPCLPSVDLEL